MRSFLRKSKETHYIFLILILHLCNVTLQRLKTPLCDNAKKKHLQILAAWLGRYILFISVVRWEHLIVNHPNQCLSSFPQEKTRCSFDYAIALMSSLVDITQGLWLVSSFLCLPPLMIDTSPNIRPQTSIVSTAVCWLAS